MLLRLFALSLVPVCFAAEYPIKNFVVLMMENRAFDHLLGYLKERNPEINGLYGNETQALDPNNTTSSRLRINANGYDEGPDDPAHGFDDTTLQIYGYKKPMNVRGVPKMDGFVLSAVEHGHSHTNPISMFAPSATGGRSAAPVINDLALEFAVFDEWFCSVPGPTDPNRGFAMSGTSNGMVTNYNGTLWSQQSYFDLLTKHNVSWRAHYQDDLWAIMYYQDMHTAVNSKNVHPLDTFFTDAQRGQLAQFTWLQPRTTAHAGNLPTWQHPDASVAEGERLIQKVYEALRSSPQWNSTLFFITYDEHGGFYDHVAPPQEGVPAPDAVRAPNGFTFDRLGIRIPGIAVSPWIKKGTVVHRPTGAQRPTATSQYESTSLMATASKFFGVNQHLGNRAPWAGTFEHLVTSLSAPRTDCPTKLEGWPALTETELDEQVAEQRAKPLNDHLEIQVQFYCKHTHPSLLPGRTGVMTSEALETEIQLHVAACQAALADQGAASDFIVSRVPHFWAALKLAHTSAAAL